MNIKYKVILATGINTKSMTATHIYYNFFIDWPLSSLQLWLTYNIPG